MCPNGSTTYLARVTLSLMNASAMRTFVINKIYITGDKNSSSGPELHYIQLLSVSPLPNNS